MCFEDLKGFGVKEEETNFNSLIYPQSNIIKFILAAGPNIAKETNN